jgi:hypothetical protein
MAGFGGGSSGFLVSCWGVLSRGHGRELTGPVRSSSEPKALAPADQADFQPIRPDSSPIRKV